MGDIVSYAANVNHEGYHKSAIKKEGQFLEQAFHFYVESRLNWTYQYIFENLKGILECRFEHIPLSFCINAKKLNRDTL